MDTLQAAIVFFLVTGFYILLFIAFREVLCWYWKINDFLKTQKKIEGHLAILVENSNWTTEVVYKNHKGKDPLILGDGSLHKPSYVFKDTNTGVGPDGLSFSPNPNTDTPCSAFSPRAWDGVGSTICGVCGFDQNEHLALEKESK